MYGGREVGGEVVGLPKRHQQAPTARTVIFSLMSISLSTSGAFEWC